MEKMKKRLIAFLTAAAVVFCLIAVSPQPAEASQEPQKRTIMLYLVGSNLERMWGDGTWNLVQAMKADYDENIDFIVMTGGTTEWKTEAEYLSGAEEVNPEYDQIWKIEGKRENEDHGIMKLIEATGIEGFEKANMSKPETLTAFIDYCYENYPADKYDLILWDHGGAFSLGFGCDERFIDPSIIEMTATVSLLGDTKLIKDGIKFEIINFDACLMSSVEIAAVLAPFTDYLVASAESEPGNGQEYTSWLNALKENPGMDGFELGRHIVDGLVKFYSEEQHSEATLSVINTKNFTERLMPEITALDKLLISEAKNPGAVNGKYNYYDEINSLLTAFEYNGGGYSLYDFGNIVGGLSALQSELDNASASEINGLTNAYTEVALRILSILNDCDGSGDDVIYTANSDSTRRIMSGYYIRGLDGEFINPNENGYITVEPTGFNIVFGDGNLDNMDCYLSEISRMNGVVDDPVIREFLAERALAVTYYSVILRIGRTVDKLAPKTTDAVTWADVDEYINQYNSFKTAIDKAYETIETYDEDFSSAEDITDYFSLIVDQQAKEAISGKKVSVKRIIGTGDTGFYQVTISGTTAQSLMSVTSSAKIEPTNYRSDEFDLILHLFYDDKPIEKAFPNGISYNTPEYEGSLDINRYYENYYENSADLLRRVYSSDTSVWIMPGVETYTFVLTDAEGNEHPAQINYKDRSKEKALVPIQLYWGNGEFSDAFLSISFVDGSWKVDGLTFNSIDERAFYPMDDNRFTGARYAAGAHVTDCDNYDALVPISQFSPIDIEKEGWGITLGWKRIEEVEEIADSSPTYIIKTFNGFRFNANSLFEEADEAALQGDGAYLIGDVAFEIGDAVYSGEAQSPEITATFNGKILEEGKDFKVLYDGSSEIGEAEVVIIGIGDFYGVRSVSYSIVPQTVNPPTGGSFDYCIIIALAAIAFCEILGRRRKNQKT